MSRSPNKLKLSRGPLDTKSPTKITTWRRIHTYHHYNLIQEELKKKIYAIFYSGSTSCPTSGPRTRYLSFSRSLCSVIGSRRVNRSFHFYSILINLLDYFIIPPARKMNMGRNRVLTGSYIWKFSFHIKGIASII